MDVNNTRYFNKSGINNASLDRIDSSKGYIEGNVAWCLLDINFMKQALDLNRFKHLCALVTNHGMEPLQAIPLTQENIEKYAKPHAVAETASAEVCRIGDNSCGS